MDMPAKKFVTVLLKDQDTAESAYQDALAQGYKPEEINVVLADEPDSVFVKEVQGDNSMDGLALGGATGGAIGGTLGAIIGIGSTVVFPGIGLVLAGPLVAGLIGAGAGSISGGLLGSLIGWGIPEDRAQLYESQIKEGSIMLGVTQDPSRPDMEKIWSKYSH